MASLRAVLPRGLVRGSTVAIAPGTGATSLMFGLMAEATRRGSWAAAVGLPGLGLAAAAAMGVVLERLAVVPHPQAEAFAVVATLLDGFELVAAAFAGGVAPAVASQISARVRKAGSVLVVMSDWPAPSVSITTKDPLWLSRGRLRCRRLTVAVRGRGALAHPAEHEVWLPDDPPFRTRCGQRDQTEKPRLRVVS